ncbi:MAG: hypothetical protein WCK65_01815 [Rhodospirillaceae bacterium]
MASISIFNTAARSAAITAIALALTAASNPVWAENAVVSAEAATALIGSLDAGLRQWFPPTGSTTNYRWDGLPKVTVNGASYDVDLPSLQINGEDGDRVEVGVIKLALTPDTDGSWSVGIVLPSPIALLNADGKQDGELAIGTQNFRGRWLPSLGTFIKAEASYGDLKAISRKDPTRLEIGSIALRSDLDEQPAGRWTGPSTVTIDRLTAIDEHGVMVARLGSIALDATVTGMDIAHAITLGGQNDTPTPPGKDATGKGKSSHIKATQAAVQRRLDILHNLLAGASTKLRIGELTMTAPGDGGAISVAQVTAHGGIKGLDQGKSELTIGYEHSGLKIVPSPGPQEFLPEKVELNLAAIDLPNANLWAAFTKLFGPSPTDQTDDQAGQIFSQQVQTALSQAGSRLRVLALRLDTPAATANLKGEAQFDEKAALGVVASFDMALRGLETAAARLQAAPTAKGSDETKNTLGMISMIQAFGTPGKDETGRDIRTYKLELDGLGRILLNGADMSALLQSGQDKEPGAKVGKRKKSEQ